MLARTLMIQGTASGVGKSYLVTGLCRLFARAGVRCAPFKALNMSLNATVTADGREIGIAQAVQAEAAGIEPTADMNPILIKPRAPGLSQIVLHGQPFEDLRHTADASPPPAPLVTAVASSLSRLRMQYDLVIAEGSGSPAELNLRTHDLANMHVAELADAPVLLVGDIARGGVFAALLGTLSLLPPEERARVQGLIVNRFHGDPALFADGIRMLEERSGLPVLGVLPHLPVELPEEDSLDAVSHHVDVPAWGAVRVAVVVHPHLANFTDLDPLLHRPDVALRWAYRPEDLAGADAVVLPGSRNTVDDLRAHRERGIVDAVRGAARHGTVVVGLCGGLQMLGMHLSDPDGLEGAEPASEIGIGLLPIRTRFVPGKTTQRVRGVVTAPDPVWAGTNVTGYLLHSGISDPLSGHVPFLTLTERGGERPAAADDTDGAWSGPTVWGTYVHGLFDTDAAVEAFVRSVRRTGASTASREPRTPPGSARSLREAAYDRLAAHLGTWLDLATLAQLTGVSLDRLTKATHDLAVGSPGGRTYPKS